MAFFSKKKAETEKTAKPWYREWSEALIVAVILALIIRSFFFQAFKIPSGSMLDTLLIGDHLLVNKFIYGLKIPYWRKTLISIKDPQTGDIIVFRPPHEPEKDFIKRVIELDVVTVKQKMFRKFR